MADRPRGVPSAPTHSTIRGEDWAAKGLSGQRHDGVRFLEADLTGQDSRGVLFTDCTFEGIQFDAYGAGPRLPVPDGRGALTPDAPP